MHSEIMNMHQAKTHLSRLVDQLTKGESSEIIIGKAGTPLAKLIPYQTPPLRRKLGGLKKEFWIAEDFDEFTPELEEMFYGKSLEEELGGLRKQQVKRNSSRRAKKTKKRK